MDVASLDFLTPLLDGVDKWAELAPLLPILILLELILSADNAVALASIVKRLDNIELQRRSLNIGIVVSLLLRILLLLTANFIIKYSFIQVLASIYLLSIVSNKYIFSKLNPEHEDQKENIGSTSFLKVTILLAFTDLAFSVDSVTAAVAISDQILLIVTGTIVGVVALRFTADLFIRWLDIYVRLETAGYIAVSLVAIKLLMKVLFIHFILPEYIFYTFVAFTFLWGFSSKEINV